MAFPVTCPACGKAFQLAAEIYERKVAGKVVSIKCKQCQAGIRVDATEPGTLKVIGATPPGGADLSVGPKPPAAQEAKAPEAQATPAAPDAEKPKPPPAAVRMRQPTLIGMMSPAVMPQRAAAPAPAPAPARPAAPAPAPTTPALWAVDSGGTGDDRELNDEEIRREIEAGNLGPQTLAWREGMGEWLEIDKIPELSRYLASAAPPEPKPELPRVPERPVAAQEAPPKEQAGFQDESDGEATMIYDRSAPNAALEPFAAPEPKAPAGAFAQTAPLGGAPPPPPPLPAAGRPASPPAARPALPAAGRPSPPAAREQLPPPPAARPEPPPPAARPEPPPPAAPALPKLPSQPPVLAAVPWGDPLPSAKPATPALPTAPYGPDPFALAASTSLDFPSPRSKKPLVIAAIVGVVVVIAIGIAIATSSSPPVANIAPPPPAPTLPAESPKVRETEPTQEPARNDSPEPAGPATQPQTPSGNFSDLFSKGAEKAKGSSSGQGARAFDEAEARAALEDVLKAAAACKEPGGQTGQTTATVTFEPSGNVSGVTVGAPFAGSSTGTCVITAFKRAKIAPFTGLPRTVTQIISLR